MGLRIGAVTPSAARAAGVVAVPRQGQRSARGGFAHRLVGRRTAALFGVCRFPGERHGSLKHDLIRCPEQSPWNVDEGALVPVQITSFAAMCDEEVVVTMPPS